MVVQAFRDIGRGLLGNNHGGDGEHQDFQPIPNLYALYQSYYDNTMYGRSGRYADPRTGKPINLRPIHNPVSRIVDWYAGRVVPGTWTADGLPSDGRPNRIPYENETSEAIRMAVQQAFSWGSQGFDLGLYVRTGATLGDVFAEIVSDPERQKVYPKLVHPKYVTDIEWNDTSDVTRYRVDIPMQDANGRPYVWGKIVEKETITTLKDGRPHGYDGEPETVPNPWGFVPAVWVQHRNVGGQHGAPCFAGVLGKIDELNGIVSEIDDYILKFTKQYVIIGTDDPAKFMEAVNGSNASRRNVGGAGAPVTDSEVLGRRDSLPVSAAKQPVTAVRLLENMGLADAVPHRDRLLVEIEQDLPEIMLNEKLLGMQQVTAPGARQLVLDVEQKLNEAAANYDAGIVKLGQMCISVAAQCIADGVWDRRGMTAAQQKFAVFSADSYDRGELAFSLVPRSLISETTIDRIAEAQAMERLGTVGGLRRAGLDEEEAQDQHLQNREAAGFAADLSSRTFSAGSIL